MFIHEILQSFSSNSVSFVCFWSNINEKEREKNHKHIASEKQTNPFAIKGGKRIE